jgi:phage-related protein
LHVFQKKSTQGIKTSKQDIELIKNRFKLAEKEYEMWLFNRRKKS